MEKEDYLPLFLHASEPIAIYVVDNKIIGCERVGDYKNNGLFAFQFLGKLMKNDVTNRFLHTQLVKRHAENFDKIPFFNPCLSGLFQEWFRNWCLAVNMSIIEDTNSIIVRFHNFALLESAGADFYVNNIEAEINLSPNDAFLLLANICLQYWLLSIYSLTKESYYNLEHSRLRLIEKYSKYKEQRNSSMYYHYFGLTFCLDYLEYLAEEITNRNLSLDRILKLNGAISLLLLYKFEKVKSILEDFFLAKANKLITNYDDLTRNEKICYYTLFLLIKFHGGLGPEHHIFNVKHPKRNLILDEIGKKFPYSKELQMDRNDVYLKYFGEDYETTIKLNKIRREKMFQ